MKSIRLVEKNIRYYWQKKYKYVKLGKVVYQGTTSKGNIIIRYPKDSDAKAMTNYINTISQEKTYIRFQGESMTLEEEAKYLHDQLKKIETQRTVQLLTLHEDKIIGISAVDVKDKTESHEGVFGISLLKEYRGVGLGKLLMNLVMKEAKDYLPQLRIVTLGVFGHNSLAYEMYSKFGFKEFGRLPEGALHRGEYVDHVYMYKKIR